METSIHIFLYSLMNLEFERVSIEILSASFFFGYTFIKLRNTKGLFILKSMRSVACFHAQQQMISLPQETSTPL